MKSSFISIGESIHASIPRTARVMKQLEQLGDDRYSKPSEPLDYIKALIESQADEGADYIAVNLDAFGEDDPQKAADMMVEYAKLVRRWGKGVPICVDSSDDNVLKAGLKEWYNTDESVKQPLINSVKVYTMDTMFPLKKNYDYAFVGLLMKEGSSSHSIDELYELAKQISKRLWANMGLNRQKYSLTRRYSLWQLICPCNPASPAIPISILRPSRKSKMTQR